MHVGPFRRYIVTGLVVWVPLGVTLWVLQWAIQSLDHWLLRLPVAWHPSALFGIYIPGLGIVLALLVLWVTGFLVSNMAGRKLLAIWEGLLSRIPVVKSIYGSVKQVSDTILSDNGQTFRKVLLVRYPHPDSWTIAFQTGTPIPVVSEQVSEPLVSVYVPTTPNPTSGFFLMLPRAQVIELNMSVDSALKYVISMGMLTPTALPAVSHERV